MAIPNRRRAPDFITYQPSDDSQLRRISWDHQAGQGRMRDGKRRGRARGDYLSGSRGSDQKEIALALTTIIHGGDEESNNRRKIK